MCPQPPPEVMGSVRTKKNSKVTVKPQVKRKRPTIGTSTAPLPLLECISIAPLLLLEGTIITPLTLGDLRYLAANFVSFDTDIVSVYDNTATYTEATVENNI